MADFIERKIAEAAVLGAASGKALYLVGGAWRALARLHMEQTRYPLHIIHEYAMPRQAAERFLDIVAGQSRRSLERITSISRKRLEAVAGRGADPAPADGGRKTEPDRVLGLRVARGLRLRAVAGRAQWRGEPGGSQADRGDALIASCQGIAASQSRWDSDGDRLYRWIAPIFPDPSGRGAGDGAAPGGMLAQRHGLERAPGLPRRARLRAHA